MKTEHYTLTVTWTGKHYEVTIPELSLTVSGATFDEAITNGNQAIIGARTAALEMVHLRKEQQSNQHYLA